MKKMQRLICPLVQEQILRRFSTLKPFEKRLIQHVAFIQRNGYSSENFGVNLSFETFKKINAIPIADDMARTLLIKTLESLLFSRGYYTTTQRLTIEYTFLSGYKIMSDGSALIYLDPFLSQVLLNHKQDT